MKMLNWLASQFWTPAKNTCDCKGKDSKINSLIKARDEILTKLSSCEESFAKEKQTIQSKNDELQQLCNSIEFTLKQKLALIAEFEVKLRQYTEDKKCEDADALGMQGNAICKKSESTIVESIKMVDEILQETNKCDGSSACKQKQKKQKRLRKLKNDK